MSVQYQLKYPKVTFYSPVTVKEGVEIGAGTEVGEYVVIGRNTRIGKDCHIMYHVTICRDAVIGDNVFIGPHTSLLNDKHPPSETSEPPTLQDGAKIGGGCMIMPGVTVGKNAVIGAGTVLTHDVGDGETVYGVPGRVR